MSTIDAAEAALIKGDRAKRIAQHGALRVTALDGSSSVYTGVTNWMKIILGFNAHGAPAEGRMQFEASYIPLPAEHLGGAAGGTKVHMELERYAKMSAAHVRSKPPALSTFARNALMALNAQGLTLIRSEVRVFDEQLGLATPVDMLCVDRNNRAVFVELKTTDNLASFARRGQRVTMPVFRDIMEDAGRASLAVMQVTLAQIIAFVRYGLCVDAHVLIVTANNTCWVPRKKKSWTGHELRAAHANLVRLACERRVATRGTR